MRERWDGLWVCGDTCWEPRNILDLYRNRSDAHKLPFIFDDSQDGTNLVSVTIKDPPTMPGEIARGTWALSSGQGGGFGNSVSRVYFYNGTVTDIQLNSVSQKLTSGVLSLQPNDLITIIYSVAPKYVRYQ